MSEAYMCPYLNNLNKLRAYFDFKDKCRIECDENMYASIIIYLKLEISMKKEWAEYNETNPEIPYDIDLYDKWREDKGYKESSDKMRKELIEEFEKQYEAQRSKEDE